MADGNKFLQYQVGPSSDYSDDYVVTFAAQVGIRIQQGVNGVMATGSDIFASSTATFLSTHVGQYVAIWDSGYPGNEGVFLIHEFVNTTEVRLRLLGGGMPTFTTETDINWAHHEKPSLDADLAFIRTMLAKTRHPTRDWNDTDPRKGILHVAAPIAAETTVQLPNGLTYAIDASHNGLYLDVFVNGELWTPDTATDTHDYEEFSSNRIRPHHDLVIGDILILIVRGG